MLTEIRKSGNFFLSLFLLTKQAIFKLLCFFCVCSKTSHLRQHATMLIKELLPSALLLARKQSLEPFYHQKYFVAIVLKQKISKTVALLNRMVVGHLHQRAQKRECRCLSIYVMTQITAQCKMT